MDECLTLSFQATGDDFDLVRDLTVPTVAECMQDKHPQELAGLPVALKIEIGKVRARHRIGREGIGYLLISPSRTLQVEFQEASGRRVGPIELNIPVLPLHELDPPSLQRRPPHEYFTPPRVEVNTPSGNRERHC